MSVYSIPQLCTTLSFATLAFLILSHRPLTRAHFTFAWFALSTLWWQGWWTVLFNVKDPAVAQWIMKIGYSGILFVPSTYYHFIVEFLNLRSRRRLAWIFHAITFVFMVFLWTGPHVVHGYYAYKWGFYPKATWMHSVWLLLLGYLALQVISLPWKSLQDSRGRPVRERQIRFMLIANACYVFGCLDFLPKYGIDFFPLGSLGVLAAGFIMSQIIDPSVVYQRLLVFSIFLGLVGAPIAWAGRYWPTASLWAALVAGVGLYPIISRMLFQWTDLLPLFRTRIRPLHELTRRSADLLRFADVQEWAWKTMASVKRTLGVRSASLLVWDEGLRIYLVKAGFGLPPDQMSLLSLEPDSALINALAARPVIAPTLTGEPLSEIETAIQEDMEFLHAALVAPFRSDGRLFAVLIVGEKVLRTMFNDLEIEGLRAIAAEAERGFQAVRAGLRRQEESSLWAHDLARPFGAKGSLGQVEAVAEGKYGVIPPKATAVLKRVAEEMEFVGRHLGQVISLGGEKPSPVSAVSLADVYGRVHRKFLPSAEEKGIDWRVEAPGETVRVLCDEELIEHRVLGNLVENAMRHTLPGGRVELGWRLEGERFVGSVKDTGSGIRNEDQARVFERGFQSGEGSKGVAGLGLFSVKSVVESQGGKVWVESEWGKGTTFFFSLPSAPPKKAE